MPRSAVVELIIRAKDATSGALKSAGGALTRFKEQLFSLDTLFKAIAAGAVVSFAKKMVVAFGEQETAIIRLNSALRVNGKYTEEGTLRIQEMARHMQRLTTVADEQAIAVSATVATLAQDLTTNELAMVQKAVIGLSQVMGTDLQSAAVMVGKALSGETDILKRQGISLDTTKDQHERLGELLRKTAGFFDVATGAAGSLLGQFAQAHNVLNDVEENLGLVIVKVFGLDTAIGSLKTRVEKVNTSLEKNMGTVVKWGTTFIRAVSFVLTAFRSIVTALFSLGGMIGAWANLREVEVNAAMERLFNKVKEKYNAFALWFNAHSKVNIFELATITPEIAAESVDEAKAQLQGFVDDFTGALGDIQTAWESVKQSLEAPIVSQKAFAKGIATAGGGASLEDPLGAAKLKAERDAQNELGTSANLVARFDAGIDSAEDFQRAIKAVMETMFALKNGVGQDGLPLLGDESLLKLAAAMDEVSKRINAINPGAETSAGFTVGLNEGLKESIDLTKEFGERLGKLVAEDITQFAGALTEAFGLLASGAQDAGAEFAAAMLDAIAQVASGFAQLFAARAAGEVAKGLAGEVWSFGAAAKFMAASLAMRAVAGALHGAAGRASGGGGGSGAISAAQRTEATSGQKGDATIIIEGGLLDMSDPRQADAMSRAIQNLTGRRIIFAGKA